MNIKKDIVDTYYNCIEEEFNCKISEELLGKNYIIGKEFGKGNVSRLRIEDGIEVSKFDVNRTNLYFDNRDHEENLLEIGYCYSGYVDVFCLPNNKKYIIKKGDFFIYKTLNDIDYFKFRYDECKTISIHINFDTIKKIVNPMWKEKVLQDWNDKIYNIFKDDVLIIEKASYKMQKICEEMDKISIDNIMGYMKLKLKTIEFLDTFFQENAKGKNFNNKECWEKEIVIKTEKIIEDNMGEQLTVNKIASILNISPYKLQEAFKNITGDTVYEYIKKWKIEKATQLLKNTDMSILEIAHEIGYENPSKFSSQFKKYNNVCPLKYRKLNRYIDC